MIKEAYFLGCCGNHLTTIREASLGGYLQLMPVILASWEAGSGGLQSPGQPGQKRVLRPLSTEKMMVVVMCTCHPNYGRKHKVGGL
jgi:hypothetical protein